jgi:hypothetical protein
VRREFQCELTNDHFRRFTDNDFLCFTIVEGFAEITKIPEYRLLHRVGESKACFERTLSTLSNDFSYGGLVTTSVSECTQAIVSVMDCLHVPYIVYDKKISCFYPDKGLPALKGDVSIEEAGHRSWHHLYNARYQVLLEWWHDRLASASSGRLWYEALKSIQVVEIQFMLYPKHNYDGFHGNDEFSTIPSKDIRADWEFLRR